MIRQLRYDLRQIAKVIRVRGGLDPIAWRGLREKWPFFYEYIKWLAASPRKATAVAERIEAEVMAIRNGIRPGLFMGTKTEALIEKEETE